MKYSLIIPVYNVEKYIKRCLESIANQNYNNYEVIIVNDGSSDDSVKLIKEYIKGKKQFKLYNKENGGLSDARNYGVQYITGDYIIFIDGDDYIDSELLFKINEKLTVEKSDVVRYELKLVDDAKKILSVPAKLNIESNDKAKIIKTIIQGEYVEPAWLYVYNAKFWQKNKFKYLKNMIHEDYGLTPIVLDKAKTISYVDYDGYNYVQRENSIMAQVDYEKLKKRVNDFKEQFINHRKKIKPTDKSSKLILSFSAEALIYKGRELKEKELDEFINFIKEEKVVNQIYAYSFKKFLQKIYLQLFLTKRLKNNSAEFFNNL